MSIQKYEQARELIDAAGGGDFAGMKPEALVVKAETALGLKFPPSYRRFLLEMGCGNIYSLEIYGLINDVFEKSSIPNGIWLTLDERRTIGLHPAYVIIGDVGDGAVYGIDTREVGTDGEAPIVMLSVDRTQSERIADSFGDYFLEAVGRVV